MLPEICIYPPPIGSPRNLHSLAGPPPLNLKMGSIPGASQGVDINYNKPGGDDAGGLGGRGPGSGGPGSPFSPLDSPSSPCTSWEESMMQLSRDLQIICRSPDRYDVPVFPESAAACGALMPLSGPTSPIMTSATTSTATSAVAVAAATAFPAARSASPTVVPASTLTAAAAATAATAVAAAAAEVVMRDAGKLLNVRHVQSEETLREKLSHICRSPRHSRSSNSSGSDSDSARLKPTKMATIVTAAGSAARAAAAAVATATAVAGGKRRAGLHALPYYFKAHVDIGDHTIEDLSVLVEAHQLRVFSERKAEGCAATRGDLPATVDLPADVNPQKLICIVRDGVLEVKESKRRCTLGLSHHKALGRQLSMSCSSPPSAAFCGEAPRATGCGATGRHHTDQCPIVIEDDGSHLLKLVLRVPPGFRFEDLRIKTVDNQLVVSGRHGPQRSLSASFSPPSWNKENRKQQQQRHRHGDEHSFTNVFELPASVDPFSMTARLTDQHQLIIQATLSPRGRSNTM